MVKVSVIVPVYNAEKYIEKSVNSLLKQTLTDMEFILVNDGSVDRSLEIIRKLERQYPHKIKVVDQENSGPGGARNSGILVAKGEYIGFLDSDDTQDYRMYEILYNKAISKDFDMVVCDTTTVYSDKEVLVKSGIDDDRFSKEDIKKDMIFSYAVVWNKLIKKQIVVDTMFSKKIWYEDVEFLFKLFPKINSIGVVNESLCNYIQTDNSITYTFNEKIYDICRVLNNIINYYKDNGLYDEYFSELEYSYVRYMYGTFIRRIAKTKNKLEYKKAVSLAIREVNDYFPNYKKNKYLSVSGGKSLYMKLFNKWLAKGVYLIEKNKMSYGIQNFFEKILSKK